MRANCRLRCARVRSGQALGQHIGGFLFTGYDIGFFRRRQGATDLRDDQHLLQPRELGSGLYQNGDVGRSFRVVHHSIHRSHGQATRIDLISAAGDDGFAGLDALVGWNVDDLRLASCIPAQNAAQPGLLQNDAQTAGLIVDLQNLRGVREDIAHLADNAIGRDDGHIRMNAVCRAFVNVEDAGLVGAAGSNHLRGHGLIDVLLLETQQRLQSLILEHIFNQRCLLQAQTIHFCLQTLVALAHMAQVDVTIPGSADAMTCKEEEFFKGSQAADDPISDQANLRTVPARSGGGSANLHGKANHLDEQNGHQHQDIAVSAVERFHAGFCLCDGIKSATRRGEGRVAGSSRS